jgi:hypothetical protein
MASNPKIAVAITAKTWSRYLNIAYHRHTGIEHVYVYLDETDDECREILVQWPFVTLNYSITLMSCPSEESGIGFPNYSRNGKHTIRPQMINAHHARFEARKAGYDLVSIDVTN